MRLSTLWRPLALLALLAPAPAWAQTARTAADLERPDVQEAAGMLARGEVLFPFQKALLDEIRYTPPQEVRSGNHVLSSVAGAEAAAVGARPAGQPTPIPASAARAILLTEDFASVTAGSGSGATRVPGTIPAGWSTVPVSVPGAWGGLTNAAYGAGANKYVGFNDDASGSGGLIRDYILTAPSVSTVGTATVFVVFDYSYRRVGTAERFAVEYSTDGGTTWQTGVADLPITAANSTSLYPLVVDQQVALPANAGEQADLRVRFRYNDASAFAWYGSVDNVRISTTSLVSPPLCATLVEPADLATDLEGALYLNWTAPATGAVPSGYKVSIGTNNPPTNIFNATVLAAGPVILSGALPNTVYYWQVVPTGGGGDAVGCPIRSFTTKALGTVAAFPWTETFDASTNGGAGVTRAHGILPGWFNRAGAQDFWRTAASTETEPVSGPTADHTSGTGRMAWLDDSTPPTATNAQWWTPRLDLTQVANPQLKFWYQNVPDGNTTTTALPTLSVLVSTDNGVTFGPSVLTVSARVNTWTEFTVSLNPFSASTGAIVAFSATESTGSVSDAAFDDVSVVAGPTNPVASVTPATGATLALGAGGFCSSTAAPQTVRITNTSGGTLTTGTGTLSGANADQFTVTGGPASLGGGFSATYTVTFTPTFGTTGAQTATLTIPYNDGAAQTLTYTLTGTASNTNLSTGTGGGIAFRNANAACTASATAPAPSGTAFIDIGGATPHAQVTTWTDDGPTGGDDSYFTLDVAALDALVGSVRLWGRTYETFNLNSNGFINSTPSGGVYDGLPSSAYGDAVAAFAQDLDVRGTTYDAADPGVYPVGMYYGLENVDADAAQELVVTWFHVYDFNSTTYADPLARYITVQLIVDKAAKPNEDDNFEVRFPAGNDAVGVPFSRNVSSTLFEGDAAIGMTNAAGTATVEYRDNALPAGPIFLGVAANAVRFAPETQAMAMGAAGYRMMGAPVTGYTVGRLADLNLVQSVLGQYPNYAFDNVYTFDGTAYVPAANVTDALAPGRGFLWYLFNIDQIPANPADGPGTSRSYTLPMALQGTGQTPTLAVSVPLTATGSGFNLVANPFRSSLNVAPATVAAWAVGGTLASAVAQAYDPSTGSYVLLAGDVATAWQGFFVQNNTAGGATSLSIPTTAQTTGGTFVGLTADAPTGVLAFRLDGTDAATGAATTDVAAALAVSAEMGTDGWDLLDASKLTPLVTTYATVGFQGVGPDGQAAVKAQESRPPTAEAFDVPLVVDAVGTAPALALSWAGLDALPATWGLELRDLVTGAVVDMRTASTYAFEHAADPALTLAPEAIMARTTTAAQAKATAAPRFVLHVTTGRTTATEDGAITEFALAAPAPNPTAGAAVVSFDVPAASAVSVAVYDLLGRRVAILAEGEMAAGRHTSRLEAGALAPGVYVVRMQAGTFSAVRRVTVVR